METPGQLPQGRASLALMENSKESGETVLEKAVFKGKLTGNSNRFLRGDGKHHTPNGTGGVLNGQTNVIKFGAEVHGTEGRITIGRATK